MATILVVRHGVARAAELLGSSAAMRDLANQIERLAASDHTHALLLGEIGTGKGRVAEFIHTSSPRSGRAYVEVSCVGATAAELELELFGSRSDGNGEEGRRGAVEMADGGSLFLDEIASLDLHLQERLLSLIDARLRRAPDHERSVPDVRLIAASSRDLVAEVRAGRFREDLYYRLSVMPIHLPPLRARSRADVLDLIAREMNDLHRHLPDAPGELTDDALELLMRHPWPGNARELRNVLERAMIAARGSRKLGVEHMPSELRGSATTMRHTPRSLAEVERAHIERTLRAHNANRTRSARELGISRATLINKIKAYQIDDPPNGTRRQTPDDASTRPIGREGEAENDRDA
ncbi:MAG TPA: sigma 54-interacting transcriptional regulator [Gemmatimonadaceae bacterium]|nr:sigma 54-interacting transcriptional regulator [Gemmatimonadaceae bacterium]